MTWFDLPRVPEPEVMDDSNEVQAYSSAAAEAYLSKIDDSFVEHALRLISPFPGRALDIGCGPGQILTKLAARLPRWQFFGIDRSLAMIHRARKTRDSRAQSHVNQDVPSTAGNICVLAGDAGSLPFRDSSFDLILC